MVPNFIQQRWSWIPGFQSLVFKAQSNASSWSVLTMSANQQLTSSVIPTGLEKSFHLFSQNLYLPFHPDLNTPIYFFFSFQKVVFYASIHLCRAGGF